MAKAKLLVKGVLVAIFDSIDILPADAVNAFEIKEIGKDEDFLGTQYQMEWSSCKDCNEAEHHCTGGGWRSCKEHCSCD